MCFSNTLKRRLLALCENIWYGGLVILPREEVAPFGIQIREHGAKRVEGLTRSSSGAGHGSSLVRAGCSNGATAGLTSPIRRV